MSRSVMVSNAGARPRPTGRVTGAVPSLGGSVACLQHHTEAALLGFSDGERAFPEPGVEPNYGPSRTTRIERIDVRLDLWPAEERYVGEATIRVAPLPSFNGDV